MDKQMQILGMTIIMWLVVAVFDCPAQQAHLDSLQRVLAEAKGAVTEPGKGLVAVRTLNSLGLAFRNTGDYNTALECHSLSLKVLEPIREKASVHGEMVSTLLNLGEVLMLRGQNTEAIARYRQCLSLGGRVKSARWEMDAYRGIGLCYYNVGEYDSSERYHRQALALSEAMGDRIAIGSALSHLGNVYALTLSYDSALTYFTRASVVFTEIGATRELAHALNNIGLMYENLGDIPSGMPYLERALALRKEIGDRNDIAESLGNLGGIFLGQGEYPKGLELSLQCLSLLEETGGANVTRALYNVGIAYNFTGDAVTAGEYLKRSLALAEQQGDRSQQALALCGLGDLPAATVLVPLDYYERACRLYEEIGEKRGLALALTQLSYLHSYAGRQGKALECLERSRKLQEELGGMEIATLINKGTALARKGDYTAAEPILLRALDKADRNRSAHSLSWTNLAMGEYWELRGDSGRALRYFKEHLAWKDTLLNQRNRESLNELRVRFETEKNEQKISMLLKDKQLRELEITRQREALMRSSLERDRQRQQILIAERGREIAILERVQVATALQLKEAAIKTASDSLTLLAAKSRIQETIAEKERITRNALLAGIALALIVGFLGVRRIQHKKKEATMRAEAAEYQAQMAEYHARASETEILRVHADAERRQREAQQTFSRQLIASQEQERRRIAGELHDQLGQDLVLIRNSILLAVHERRAVETLSETASSAGAVLDSVRRLARDLRPIQLDRYGLTSAVTAMVARADRSGAIRFAYEGDTLDGVFATEEEISVYRIIQEGINNIIRHSGAHRATVRFAREDDAARLSIEDDGKGFVPSEDSYGFGLQGIMQRVALLAGSMQVRSGPGAGTTLVIAIPLNVGQASIASLDAKRNHSHTVEASPWTAQ